MEVPAKLTGRITGACGALQAEIVDGGYLYICDQPCRRHHIGVAAADRLATRYTNVETVELLSPGRLRMTHGTGGTSTASITITDADVDFDAVAPRLADH